MLGIPRPSLIRSFQIGSRTRNISRRYTAVGTVGTKRRSWDSTKVSGMPSNTIRRVKANKEDISRPVHTRIEK